MYPASRATDPRITARTVAVRAAHIIIRAISITIRVTEMVEILDPVSSRIPDLHRLRL